MIEDQLRDHYTGYDVDPTAERRLIELAMVGRTRNVQGALAVGATVAAVAVLAVGVAVVPGLTSTHHSTTAEPATPSSSPAAVARVAPTPTAAVAAPVALTPQVLVQTLNGFLAGRGTVSGFGGRTVSNLVAGQLVFDDGHGASQIYISLTSSPINVKDAQPTGCAFDGSTGCRVLADGTHVSIAKGLEYPNQPATSSTEWDISAFRPDGLEVAIIEWNAATPKDSPVSRPLPPLSVEDATAIVTSPQWTQLVPAATAAAAASLFTPDVMPGATK